MPVQVNGHPNAGQGDPAKLAEFLTRQHAPIYQKIEPPQESVGLRAAQVAMLPAGMSIHSLKLFLDEYRDRPERRQGTATHQTLQSFIDHMNRFKDAGSAIWAYAHQAAASLVGVIDYHPGGEAALHTQRWCLHRAKYAFPPSPEWGVWAGKNGASLSQAGFAEFLEDNLADVVVFEDVKDALLATGANGKRMIDLHKMLGSDFASPARLMDLSRGLQVTSNEKVANAIKLTSGEAQITFETTHTASRGQEQVKVPSAFIVVIPVFHRGEAYPIICRLRYRLVGGQLSWSYQMHRPDWAFDDAFHKACKTAVEETSLPLFTGTAEA